MKSTIIKSAILFISIPLINSILFGIGTLIHSPNHSIISIEDFNAYHQATILLITATSISILAIELLHDFIVKNDTATTAIYLASFAILAFLTQEQFTFRPLEHGLTFICILSILVSRLYFKNKVVIKGE